VLWEVYVSRDRKKCVQDNNLLGIIMGVQTKLSLRSFGKDLFQKYIRVADINYGWRSTVSNSRIVFFSHTLFIIRRLRFPSRRKARSGRD